MLTLSEEQHGAVEPQTTLGSEGTSPTMRAVAEMVQKVVVVALIGTILTDEAEQGLPLEGLARTFEVP